MGLPCASTIAFPLGQKGALGFNLRLNRQWYSRRTWKIDQQCHTTSRAEAAVLEGQLQRTCVGVACICTYMPNEWEVLEVDDGQDQSQGFPRRQ